MMIFRWPKNGRLGEGSQVHSWITCLYEHSSQNWKEAIKVVSYKANFDLKNIW
jgi:hypothetical protein